MYLTLVTLLVGLMFPAPPCASDAPDGAGTRRPTAPAARLAWGQARRSICGVHAAYVLSRMAGADATFADVLRRLGTRDTGHSMLELRDALRDLGTATDVRRVGPGGLARLEPPFVTLSKVRFERQGVPVGHYLVVLGMDDERVRYLETTGGVLLELPPAEFEAKVVDTVLVGVRAEANAGLPASAWLLAGAAGALLGLFRARRMARALVLCLCVLGPLAAPAWARDVDEPRADLRAVPDAWRALGRDAVNGLALLLALDESPAAPSRLLAEHPELVGQPSMIDVQRAAARRGLELRVVRGPPDETLDARLPALAHLAGARGHGGQFIVIVSAGPERVTWLDAASCRLVEATWDEFLARWSGHLLAFDRVPGDRWSRSLVLAAAGGLITLLVLRGAQRWSA